MLNQLSNSNKDLILNDVGYMTKIWGPHLWFSLHTITFGYPINPTNEDKNNYLLFFKQLGYVLPCVFCRESYQRFIETEPTILNLTVLESKESLTQWLYHLHNRVNNKLHMSYNISYKDVVKKFESFKAICVHTENTGCKMTPESKKIAYTFSKIDEMPIISIGIANVIKKYAIKRGINMDKLDYYFINKDNIYSDIWIKRNKECSNIITNMRLNNIAYIEKEGEFKDLPTIDELNLISRLCSNLNHIELFNITKLLGEPVYIKYDLYI